MTGGHVNESRSCGENEECHSRHPIRFGEWGGLCRVPIGPNAPELLIEGTGTVSVRASVASALPKAAFAVSDEPDACRLSDDYWLSHFLRAAGECKGKPRRHGKCLQLLSFSWCFLTLKV